MSGTHTVVEGTATAPAAPMELEHAIGCSTRPNVAHHLPPLSNTDSRRKYAFVVGGCVCLANADDPHSQVFLRGHDDDIMCMAVSLSGKLMVTGQRGRNADVCVWDLASLTVRYRIPEHDRGVCAVAVSRDDTFVASVGDDHRLAFFDTSNGQMVTHTPLHGLLTTPEDHVRSVVIGPHVQDAKRRNTKAFHVCVVATSSVAAYHLDPYAPSLTTPAPLQLAHAFHRRYTCAQFSEHADLLFVGSEAGDVAVVATANGAVGMIQRVCAGGVRSLNVVLPCGHEWSAQLAAAQAGDAQGGSFHYARIGPGSERHTKLFVGGGDGTVAKCVVSDHSTPALDVAAKRQVDAAVSSMCILDGAKSDVLAVTTAGSTFTLHISDQRGVFHDGVEKFAEAVPAPVSIVSPHPVDPTRFTTAAVDGQVSVWELDNYTSFGQCQMGRRDGALGPANFAGTQSLSAAAAQTAAAVEGAGHATANAGSCVCTALVTCPDLDLQLSAWTDGSVKCHDMGDGRELLWTHTGAHRTAVTALAVSPSMRQYVTGAADGDVKVWAMRTKELQMELKDHRQPVVAIELFADERHCVTASRDRTFITWDMSTGRRLSLHTAHAGPLTALRMAKNQTTVYTTGVDRTLMQWDLRQQDRPTRGAKYGLDDVGGRGASPDAFATCLALSHSETLLGTGGSDQVVRLWDERTLQPLATGRGHSAQVSSVGFTVDDKQLLSAGGDSAVLVWNVYAQ